jgi:hypothetical protein
MRASLRPYISASGLTPATVQAALETLKQPGVSASSSVTGSCAAPTPKPACAAGRGQTARGVPDQPTICAGQEEVGTAGTIVAGPKTVGWRHTRTPTLTRCPAATLSGGVPPRRWRSGQDTAWRCSYASTPQASLAMRSWPSVGLLTHSAMPNLGTYLAQSPDASRMQSDTAGRWSEMPQPASVQAGTVFG